MPAAMRMMAMNVRMGIEDLVRPTDTGKAPLCGEFWQKKIKIAARAGPAGAGDRAAVGHHNFPGDGQTEPGALLRLGGHTVEFLENERHAFRRNSRPLIAHAK